MRRPTSVLSSSLAAIGLSASIALAQQSSQGFTSSGLPSTNSASSIDPSMASRPTRFLLRNGLDYLAYREYARALSFLKAAEARQAELNDAELASLKKGISQAQQGMREAVNGNKVVTGPVKGRPGTQPGSFALAKGATKAPTDAIQRTSLDLPELPTTTPAPATPKPRSNRTGPALPAAISESVALPDPEPASTLVVAPVAPPMSKPASTGGVELPALPDSTTSGLPGLPESAPSLPAQGPTVDPSALPAQSSLPSPVDLPPTTPTPLPSNPPAPIILESSTPTPTPTPVELPSVETPMPTPVELPPAPTSLPVELPTSPPMPMPMPMPAESPGLPSVDPVPRAMVADAGQRPDSTPPAQPATLPEPPPAPEVAPVPETRPAAPTTPPYAAPTRTAVPDGPVEPVLTDRLRREVDERYHREVEQIAQGPGNSRAPGSSAVDPNDPGNISPFQGSPRLAIERAPSPTEARPLRRIQIPEENTPLGKREWDPNRKYWAAAGTCHMILYFQDPVLERYGQGVEQSLGSWGRYFSYPLDDPRQSNQRNQILQPFYSMGKLCFQVGTLPYKLVVDPPWESEYDLGYYRPGDRIPPDTIFITPFGVGPPLKGRNY